MLLKSVNIHLSSMDNTHYFSFTFYLEKMNKKVITVRFFLFSNSSCRTLCLATTLKRPIISSRDSRSPPQPSQAAIITASTTATKHRHSYCTSSKKISRNRNKSSCQPRPPCSSTIIVSNSTCFSRHRERRLLPITHSIHWWTVSKKLAVILPALCNSRPSAAPATTQDRASQPSSSNTPTDRTISKTTSSSYSTLKDRPRCKVRQTVRKTPESAVTNSLRPIWWWRPPRPSSNMLSSRIVRRQRRHNSGKHSSRSNKLQTCYSIVRSASLTSPSSMSLAWIMGLITIARRQLWAICRRHCKTEPLRCRSSKRKRKVKNYYSSNRNRKMRMISNLLGVVTPGDSNTNNNSLRSAKISRLTPANLAKPPSPNSSILTARQRRARLWRTRFSSA